MRCNGSVENLGDTTQGGIVFLQLGGVTKSKVQIRQPRVVLIVCETIRTGVAAPSGGQFFAKNRGVTTNPTIIRTDYWREASAHDCRLRGGNVRL